MEFVTSCACTDALGLEQEGGGSQRSTRRTRGTQEQEQPLLGTQELLDEAEEVLEMPTQPDEVGRLGWASSHSLATMWNSSVGCVSF